MTPYLERSYCLLLCCENCSNPLVAVFRLIFVCTKNYTATEYSTELIHVIKISNIRNITINATQDFSNTYFKDLYGDTFLQSTRSGKWSWMGISCTNSFILSFWEPTIVARDQITEQVCISLSPSHFKLPFHQKSQSHCRKVHWGHWQVMSDILFAVQLATKFIILAQCSSSKEPGKVYIWFPCSLLHADLLNFVTGGASCASRNSLSQSCNILRVHMM